MGTLREDRLTFMIMSRWVPLRMGDVSDTHCGESKHTFYVQ